jgi:hypothetical protein
MPVSVYTNREVWWNLMVVVELVVELVELVELVVELVVQGSCKGKAAGCGQLRVTPKPSLRNR